MSVSTKYAFVTKGRIIIEVVKAFGLKANRQPMKPILPFSRSMRTYKAENVKINFLVLIFLLQIHVQIHEHVPHLSLWRFRTSHPKCVVSGSLIDCCLLWTNITNELSAASVLQAHRLLRTKWWRTQGSVKDAFLTESHHKAAKGRGHRV